MISLMGSVKIKFVKSLEIVNYFFFFFFFFLVRISSSCL